MGRKRLNGKTTVNALLNVRANGDLNSIQERTLDDEEKFMQDFELDAPKWAKKFAEREASLQPIPLADNRPVFKNFLEPFEKRTNTKGEKSCRLTLFSLNEKYLNHNVFMFDAESTDIIPTGEHRIITGFSWDRKSGRLVTTNLVEEIDIEDMDDEDDPLCPQSYCINHYLHRTIKASNKNGHLNLLQEE